MTNTLTHIESAGIFNMPPLSVAVRAGNMVFVSGTHHISGVVVARSADADRN